MPIPSSIPQQEKSAYISQNSSATTRSDVILQTLYAAGEGADCLWKIAKEGIKRINEKDVALGTIFGWCIQGRLSFSELNSAKSICSNLLVEEKLSRTLESLGNIESLGVSSPDERLEDEEALRFFENSILQKNDRYEEIAAPLPPDRIEKSQHFEVSGIDFAGPLILRDGSKVYIALFTYAVNRGIRLELISSLTTECFIQAFRRFISRRGVYKIVYSDNTKTFKRANKELKYLYKLCKNENVSRFIVNNGITWKFIIEAAPWWRGFWERLVRSVKTCLKRILGKSSLTYEELYTGLSTNDVTLGGGGGS
ncbi:hypothetical protein AVEN_19804-1 [Araneus ventricosus]|uniref:Integrase catalytic domain-containing protein n=1 Tax=Araneus ventricosus TaxID=182803 RepID=A0A4Y2Q8J4_ARAVE|nr:hypothetical protein AVEN_19804-1 [Araneus ventricosus]